MFQVWETTPYEFSPLIITLLILLGITLLSIFVILLQGGTGKNKEKFIVKYNFHIISTLCVFFGITMFSIIMVMSYEIVHYGDSYESYLGNRTGVTYDNPYDGPENNLKDHKTVALDSEKMEELLAKSVGIDKVQTETTYELLRTGKFAEFTGIDSGDVSDPTDDRAVSGVFYYTETDLIIITDYDTEHQETVTISTK